MFILENILLKSTDHNIIKLQKKLEFYFKNDRIAKVINALYGINK